MTDEKKETKVVFAPGCFDHFEGTQEELDELVKDIQKMFEGKTHEEIKSSGRVVDPDDLPPEILAQLAEHFFDEEELNELESMGMPRNRKLQ